MKNLQKHFWVIPVFTIAAVFFFAARGAGILPSRDTARELSKPKPAPKTISHKEIDRVKPVSQEDTKIILDRNIFDSTVGSLLHAPTPDVHDPDSNEKLNLDKLSPCQGFEDTRLEATIADDSNPAASFATINQSGTSSSLSVGDEIQNRKIVAITWRYVILQGSSDFCYLDLF